MKAIRLMLWLTLISVSTMVIMVSCTMIDRNKNLAVDEPTWDKAEFYPSQIVDMYHATSSKGEACYWLIYDDIDAGFDNEIISMDETTFYIIKDIWVSDEESQKALIEVHNPMIYYNLGTCVLLLKD